MDDADRLAEAELKVPASTLATGGVTFRISIVAEGAAAADGARTTDAAATESQPRTATATPLRAVRRMRPVAMCERTSDSTCCW